MALDGQSTFRIVGEIHTIFDRGQTLFSVSSLVVNVMYTYILSGTSFHDNNEHFPFHKDNEGLIEEENLFKEYPDQFKEIGNTAFRAGNWEEALVCYTEALELATY